MDENEKHPVRAWVGITLALVILGFMGFRGVTEYRFNKELNRSPAAPAWAQKPTTNWPNLVLMQTARFKNHTGLQGGCASLVRLSSGEIVALTAGHLLDKHNGVKPGFGRGGLGGLDTEKLGTLESEIISWRLFSPGNPNEGVEVNGLAGPANKFDRDCDQVLLRLTQSTNLPVTALGIRTQPTEIGESLWVVGCEMVDGEMRQAVRPVRRIQGLGFTCELITPARLDGWSGAPVVDRNGNVVAILTGGTIMDFMSGSLPRGFSGHEITELKPVFKAVLKQKLATAEKGGSLSSATAARLAGVQK